MKSFYNFLFKLLFLLFTVYCMIIVSVFRCFFTVWCYVLICMISFRILQIYLYINYLKLIWHLTHYSPGIDLVKIEFECICSFLLQLIQCTLLLCSWLLYAFRWQSLLVSPRSMINFLQPSSGLKETILIWNNCLLLKFSIIRLDYTCWRWYM